jgi:hypothetical protein
MSDKIIDIFNTLNFVSDFNNTGLTVESNRLTVDSGGVLTLFNTTQSQYSSVGALVLQNGGLSINAFTNATSVSNGGALTVAGGAAIGGDLIVGGSILYANAEASSSTFAYLTLTSTDQSIDIANGSLITFGGISIQTSANATSITSGGGLTIAGGAAVFSDFYVGGSIFSSNLISDTLEATTTTISNALFTNATFTNISSSTINVTDLTAGNINFTGSLYENGSLYISSQFTTFGNNIAYTKGNVGINTTAPSYHLDINGSLRVSGTNGTLNLLGSNTLTDILQLQNTNASGSSTIQFLNNTGTNKGAFGFGNANKSSLQNTMYLSSVIGTPINFIAGNNTANPFILNASDNSVSITSTTPAIDTSSGSLKVSGGASIRGDLYIGGSVNVNSPLTVNINNTTYSSNSTTGAMKLIGGLSISVTDTTNSNATSYTAGGGITIKGGLAISQDTFIGGILDIQSGANNLNPIKLQSLQISSNYNNGASTVIQSGDSARTSTSFTPILFSGYNDQTNPKLSINASTIVTNNSFVGTNTSNTFGPLITNGVNIGLGTVFPSAHLDIINTITNTFGNLYLGNNIQNRKLVLFNGNGSGSDGYFGFGINSGVLRYQVNGVNDSHVFYAATNSTTSNELVRITGTGNIIVAGTSNSVSVSAGNIFSTNISTATLRISSGLTTGNINFTGVLSQNGTPYVNSQWIGTSGTTLYYNTSGTALVGIGTSNPSYNLDVVGSIHSDNAIFTSLTSNNIYFTGEIYKNGLIYGGTGGTGGISSQWDGSSGSLIYFGSTGSVFVGIGTTNPTYTLDVNGPLRASTLTLGNNTGGSINSTNASIIFTDISISSTRDVSSFTQGGAVTIAGGLAVEKSISIGSAFGMAGITSDIAGTFNPINNISTPTEITGLLFPSANIRSFTVTISIQLLASSGNLYAHYTIEGLQNSSGWSIGEVFIGDVTGIVFSINTTSGQLLYTSTNITGWISNTLNYNSKSFSISGNYIQNAPPTSGNFLVTENLTIQGTTEATSASYGSIVTSGGAGIAKNVNVGGSVVINNISSMSSGTFNAANGTVTNGSITGLIFNPSVFRSFVIVMSVSILRTSGGNYNAQYTIEGILRDSGWNIYVSSLGDTIDLTFSINTSTGQLEYSSTTTYTNWTSTVFNYQVTVIYVSGGYSTFTLPSADSGIITIINTTNSTNTSTGSLILQGGLAVQKDTNIGGNLQVSGNLAKSSGTFDIPHPILENKRLVHSFIEGPRCDLIYRGTVVLNNGTAIVNIDNECTFSTTGNMTQGTFNALCSNPVCYLQNNNSFDRIKGNINNNILTIICENNTSNDNINWLIIAERKDDYIKTWERTDSNGYLVTEY